MTAGALTSALLATLWVSNTAISNPSPDLAAETRNITAGHVPPLLTTAGESPTLRYAITCGSYCQPGGEVRFVNGVGATISSVGLVQDKNSTGELVANVPSSISSNPNGFSYYAVLTNERTGDETTVPAGGAMAPSQSKRMQKLQRITLEPHTFGSVRAAAERMVDIPWGTGPDQVGLLGGEESTAIGPSAFDVGAEGDVTLLDQNNKRVMRWHGTQQGTTTGVDVSGGIADMSVGADGTIYVLEPHGRGQGPTPLLETFTPAGELRSSGHIAERTGDRIRVTPSGPVVRQYPSEQWMPLEEPANGLRDVLGRPLSTIPKALNRVKQAAGGRPGLPGMGGDVTVQTDGHTIRVAETLGNIVKRSWEVQTPSDLAEIQLAQATQNGLVLITRVYTDTDSEFLVMTFNSRGLVSKFALDTADWAETAPLTRFRLVGNSLYQLGSTPSGTHIDRFDMEFAR